MRRTALRFQLGIETLDPGSQGRRCKHFMGETDTRALSSHIQLAGNGPENSSDREGYSVNWYTTVGEAWETVQLRKPHDLKMRGRNSVTTVTLLYHNKGILAKCLESRQWPAV